ncbi:hypothetical protein OIU79_023199 [Salix purpurea]|uniref:Uncharacterized protein n=1 Tax=Salix purpurea TaxID=77065 RepID=A0A9Q0WHH9_SALPP|nr:hypothetical protein OIU79_023199 [Salix purpurea]
MKVIWVMKAAMAAEVDGSLITIITMMIAIKIGEVVEAFTGVVEILAPKVKEVVMVVVEEEVLRVMEMKEVDMEKGMGRDGAGGGAASVEGGGSGGDGGVGSVYVVAV